MISEKRTISVGVFILGVLIAISGVACGDGIDGEDLAFFAARWLETGCSDADGWCDGADLDYDGKVSLVDFQVFGAGWLNETAYYVSDHGDDSNPGTLFQPFRTIQKAANVMGSGDTCYVRGGTYPEEVVKSGLRGSASSPIVFTAYGDEKVVIDGTVSIEDIKTNGWTLHGNGIYKTTLSQDIWQLFLDGEMMIAGRWPNASFDDNSIWDREVLGHGSTGSEYRTMATLTGGGLPDLAATGLDFTGAMAILNIGKFSTYCQPITSHTAGSGSFTYGAISGEASNSKYWDDGYWELTQRYYLEAHLNCVDVAREWYFDKDTKEL